MQIKWIQPLAVQNATSPLDDSDKANPLQGMQIKWTQPLAVQNATSPLDDSDKTNPLQGMQIKWTQPLAVQNTTSVWMTETWPALYKVCRLNGHSL